MEFDYEKLKAELSAIKEMNEKWVKRKQSFESIKLKKDQSIVEKSEKDPSTDNDAEDSK